MIHDILTEYELNKLLIAAEEAAAEKWNKMIGDNELDILKRLIEGYKELLYLYYSD